MRITDISAGMANNLRSVQPRPRDLRGLLFSCERFHTGLARKKQKTPVLSEGAFLSELFVLFKINLLRIMKSLRPVHDSALRARAGVIGCVVPAILYREGCRLLYAGRTRAGFIQSIDAHDQVLRS